MSGSTRQSGPSGFSVDQLDDQKPRWGEQHVRTMRILQLIQHLKLRREPYDPDEITVVDRPMLKRAVTASAVGNCMEWFDFGVYGYLATVIGANFFPSDNPAASNLGAFTTFAAAFLVRPLGGLFFGPLGDKIGRQRVLATTMILMAIGTFAVGFIPTYGTIGVFAPILLLLARLLQGFSTGGEYAGATTFVAEYSPDKQRGFFGSFLDFGTFLGYAMGSGLVTILTAAMGSDAMQEWGWRIPFWIAGPIGLIGLYLRLKLEDTPAFRKKLDEHGQDVKKRETEGGAKELKRIFVGNWKPMLVCVGLVLLYNVTNYVMTGYMVTYLKTELGTADLVADMAVLVSMLTVVASIVFVGALSDRIGRKPVFTMAAIAQIVLAIPLILLIIHGGSVGIFIACIIFGLLLACFAAPTASTLPALFPTAIRYGALSIAFNVSVSLFGGTTPLVNEALVGGTGNLLVPGFYMVGSGLVGLVALLALKESATQSLEGSPPQVAEPEQAEQLSKDTHELVRVLASSAGDVPEDADKAEHGSQDPDGETATR
jgi:MHS family proline/betaine transporter-like MFS transporter